MIHYHFLKSYFTCRNSLAVILLLALTQQAFFDPAFSAQTSGQPNIRPITPDNWSAPVVVSSVGDNFSQDELFVGTDNYINWGITNDGLAIEAAFTNCLYFDGEQVQCWQVEHLNQGEIFTFKNWQLPREVQTGSHFIQLIVDVNNDIKESAENDNQWEFDFTWIPNESIAQPYIDATPFNDALIQPDYQELTAQDASFSSAPDYYNTSRFMVGSVAVGIVFPESVGNGENWTSTEQQQAIAEIQDGLSHWKSWGGTSANLSFVYEVKYNVPTNYEPISMPMNQHCPWISEAMTNIGFPGAGGPCLSQSRDYINDLRTRKGTDWAFVIFVVDSSQDADGRFPDGYFGYAYRGGPYAVMPYDNASLGITGMDRITAHETGHIFYAADNYYIPGYGGCESTTEKYGYLGIPNSNCQKNNSSANLYTLMGMYYDKLYGPHSATKQQVGWRDSDGDSIFDPADTTPRINITSQPAGTSVNAQLTYSGTAYDQPYPHATCPVFNNCGNMDITINKITSVQYRIDGSAWTNLSAADGLFNSDWEQFTFATPNLAPGTHTIDIMTTNSAGIVNSPYWTNTVTVQTVPQPPGNFGKIAPAGITLEAANAVLSWNASFGAANYAYCYDITNDNSCSNWINTGSQTNATINGLTQETAYYWQVRASNNFGVTYADNNTFWMFNSGTPLTNVRFVVPNGLSSGTCNSWQYACDLKYAFTQVVSGNEIWVASGTYIPGTLRTDTFQLRNNVALYGGFTGVETSRSQRDPMNHLTILSGDLSHNDLPYFVNRSDNCYHVVTGSGTDNTAVLDGFTISGGYANSSTPNNFGGGMFNVSGTPTLNNLIFSGNVAYMGGGGGMYNEYSTPLMTNILFDGNLAELNASWGGWGGGIYNAMSNPSLKNVMFSGNQAISLRNGSGGWGGAVYNYQSSPTFTNTTFYSNQAGSGGGVFNNQSNPLFTNTTFSENTVNVLPGWSGGAGGGIFNQDSSPEIRNSILWGNTALKEAQLYNDTTSTPSIRYSILENGCPTGSTCQNDVLGDPLLGEIGNYSGFTSTIPIGSNSPAIDAGSNAYCPATDQRGINRPGDGNSDELYVCDIGAFEYEMVPEILSITRTNTNPTSAASINFTVTFSEPVTGVDIGDFSLTTNGVSGAAVSGANGSGSIYTVTVYTGSNNGNIRLNVMDDNSIVDVILNPLGTGFANGETYTVIKSATFTDAATTYWAWQYIERLYNAGITGGCATSPSLMYCPDSTVTRAQMAIFLLKGIHGASFTPPAINGVTNFNDVATTHWAAAWIKQLAAEGITGGCGAGIYCPEATVTRAQMAIFLLKAKHGSSYSPPTATGVFTDVPVGYWADKWIEQLAAEGVTSGCGNGNYCPDDSVTRAQMAVFLVKAFGLP